MSEQTVEEKMPTAVQWLNYKNDVRKDLRAIMGPNNMHEMLYVVSAIYTESTNMTRVGLSYKRPYRNYDPNKDSKVVGKDA